MTKMRVFLLLLVILAVGAGAYLLLRPGGNDGADNASSSGERKIAYWIAPMDQIAHGDGSDPGLRG